MSIEVNLFGLAIVYIKDPSEEMQFTAIKKDLSVLEFIEDPTGAVQLAAFKRDPELTMKCLRSCCSALAMLVDAQHDT